MVYTFKANNLPFINLMRVVVFRTNMVVDLSCVGCNLVAFLSDSGHGEYKSYFSSQHNVFSLFDENWHAIINGVVKHLKE